MNLYVLIRTIRALRTYVSQFDGYSWDSFNRLFQKSFSRSDYLEFNYNVLDVMDIYVLIRPIRSLRLGVETGDPGEAVALWPFADRSRL
jgi:hypothetical protein